MTTLRRKIRILLRVRRTFLRKLFWVCLIATFCWVIYGVIGNKILRPIATEQIAQMTGAVVKIGSTEFKINGFVRVNSLSIAPQADLPYSQDILRAESVEVRFSLLSLLKFQPKIKAITLSDFIINAQYDSELKKWSLASLKIASGAGAGELPIIRAKNGIVKAARGSRGEYNVIVIVGVDGNFTPVKEIPDTYSFYLHVDQRLGFAGSWVRGIWSAGKDAAVNLTGRIIMGQSPVFGNTWDIGDLVLDMNYDKTDISINQLKWKMGDDCTVNIAGAVQNYQSDPEYTGRLKVSNMLMTSDITPNSLVFHPSLLDKIGSKLRTFIQLYKPKGLVDIDIEVSGKLGELSQSKSNGIVDCKNVTVSYEKFPYQLEDLTGKLRITEKGITLDNLRCRHGQVELSINGHSEGTAQDWDCDINIVSENMLLDDDLYRALNTEQKRLWFVFAPSGLSKIDYRFLKHPGKAKDIKLRIDLVDAQAVYQHFPYPLRNLTGTVYIDPNTVILENVSSAYQGRRITLNGTVTETKSKRPKYNMVITATDIPIDSTLKTALPASQKKFYDQFEVDALTDAKITIFPNEVGRRLVEYIADVTIKDASLIYEGFPIPLTNVFVDAVLTADKVIINRMTGRSGQAEVTLSGDVWPANKTYPEPGFCMAFEAKQLLLEENVLRSLPPGVADAVGQLNPSGRVNIIADINLNARNVECPPYRVVIDCLGDKIKYDKFPYPLENVTGQVSLTEDRIELKNITASRSQDIAQGQTPTEIKLDGYVTVTQGSVNSGSFTFHASNLPLDKTLGDALPASFANFYHATTPSGRIDLSVDSLQLSTDSQGKKKIELSIVANLKDCSFGENALLTDTNAVFKAEAAYLIGQGLLAGQADFSAQQMKIKQRQLTNFKAHIDFDPEAGIIASHGFAADFHGGKILGDAELKLSKDRGTGYVLRLIFDDTDVKQILSANKPPSQAQNYSQGRASGSFNAVGVLGDRNSSIGRLNIAASDMTLAKRSFMGKVLASMQMTKATDYIFSDMSVEAYLKRRVIVFEQIYMSGNSMVMRGTGTLSLDTNDVDLEFSAFGGRIDPDPSFLESLAKGLGSAMVKVEVRGKFDDPTIKTTTLPVIRSPFNIFGTKP